jgi:hypothetical protein
MTQPPPPMISVLRDSRNCAGFLRVPPAAQRRAILKREGTILQKPPVRGFRPKQKRFRNPRQWHTCDFLVFGKMREIKPKSN